MLLLRLLLLLLLRRLLLHIGWLRHGRPLWQLWGLLWGRSGARLRIILVLATDESL